MDKLISIQISLLVLFAGAFGGMVVFTNIYQDIKSTIVDQVCTSCIKMDPVSPIEFKFDTVNNRPHPRFVKDNLTKGLVFLAFRTDVCHGCDEMEDVLKELFDVDFGSKELFYKRIDFDGSNISFFHINVNHVSGEFYDSFDIYDRRQKGEVPLFVVITLGNNSGNIEPYYAIAYGTLGKQGVEDRKEFLKDMIEPAIAEYAHYHLDYNQDGFFN